MQVGRVREAVRPLRRAVSPSPDPHGGEEVRLPRVPQPLHAQRPPGQARPAAPGGEEGRPAGHQEPVALLTLHFGERPRTLDEAAEGDREMLRRPFESGMRLNLSAAVISLEVNAVYTKHRLRPHLVTTLEVINQVFFPHECLLF